MTIEQMVYLHNARALGVQTSITDKLTSILFERIHRAKKRAQQTKRAEQINDAKAWSRQQAQTIQQLKQTGDW